MADFTPAHLESLRQRLAELQNRHETFGKEIASLKAEIAALQIITPAEKPAKDAVSAAATKKPPIVQAPSAAPSPVPAPAFARAETQAPAKAGANKRPGASAHRLEGFIGGNLINKIGIVITVIGVGIGAKYSIDHDLISPLTRIVLGYLLGLGLLGLAFKLKLRYTAYSAVLLGGAMAIMYFLTYIAYSNYQLFPQTVSFLLMVVFTAFTVLAALRYNMVVIAQLGLVGAYAVPFLLSNNSGHVEVLFSYMALINSGILVIAFKKYWRSLLLSSFALSWLIFLGWHFTSYDSANLIIGLSFSAVFFVLFYVAILAQVLTKRAPFGVRDVSLLLINAFLFYGSGYNILGNRPDTATFLGLFTLLNAIIHFAAGLYLYHSKSADRNVFYLVMGVVLVFLTLAVPVQLDGRWVTLLWAGEAAVLFWIGRTRHISLYEKLSYPVMLLALISLGQDWFHAYAPKQWMTPVLNVHFLSSVLVCAAFGLIVFFNRNAGPASPGHQGSNWTGMMKYALPPVLIILTYASMLNELIHYFDQWALQVAEEIPSSAEDPYQVHSTIRKIGLFKVVWGFNYTFLYLGMLWVLDRLFFHSNLLKPVLLVLNILTAMTFLVIGLYQLSELRESYLHPISPDYFERGPEMIYLRYISLALLGWLAYVTGRLMRHESVREWSWLSVDLMLHTCILWVLSSELLHWLDIAGSAHTYKLGLSILWGTYALLAISLGLWKRKKLLRYGGIGLFLLTLLKLFFYDISHLGTIAKTIVFVSLGLLLLFASFLYNKYKHLVNDEESVP